MPDATKFNVKEMLTEAMRGFDWFYQYSDDSRVWKDNQPKRERIDSLYTQLVAEVGKKEAVEFWNSKAPERWHKQLPAED